MSSNADHGTTGPTPRLTALQTEVLAILDAAYPSLLTTNETTERRTGRRYDGQDTYRALRQLEAKHLAVGYRLSRTSAVAWSSVHGPEGRRQPASS